MIPQAPAPMLQLLLRQSSSRPLHAPCTGPAVPPTAPSFWRSQSHQLQNPRSAAAQGRDKGQKQQRDAQQQSHAQQGSGCLALAIQGLRVHVMLCVGRQAGGTLCLGVPVAGIMSQRHQPPSNATYNHGASLDAALRWSVVPQMRLALLLPIHLIRCDCSRCACTPHMTVPVPQPYSLQYSLTPPCARCTAPPMGPPSCIHFCTDLC